MTCNPQWKDIHENLSQRQQSFDRPDLVCRVFHIKLKAVLNDLMQNRVLGRAESYVYTIEFQKRGLPHAHILLFLAKESKIERAEQLDRIISAEMPDQNLKPNLYTILKNTMVHKPCGEKNPDAPCMKEGKYKKHFPKEYSTKTVLRKSNYPLYKRRRMFETNATGIDNEWIITYNEYLTERYNCHINVEYCYDFNTAKYLFKYVHKGFDCAEIELTANKIPGMELDEVKDYINTRYVCAPEAMWRLLEFPLQERYHLVFRLTVHLPEEQTIYFTEQDLDAAKCIARNKNTQLTAWFLLNVEDSKTKNFLYTEIPLHYTWNRKTCTWQERKQRAEKVLSRIYTVSAKDSERFYLRLLLHNIKGARNFVDLRIINGKKCKSFKEAAVRLGLTESDMHLEDCLKEASEVCTPAQLRFIFAIISVFNSPQNPLKLFNKFLDDLSLDYFQVTKNKLISKHKTLKDINSILELYGINLKLLGLPAYKDCITKNADNNSSESKEQCDKEKNESLSVR